MYADDLCIFLRSKKLDDLKKHLQYSLNKLNSWANKNGIKFSSSKTKAIVFTRKRNNNLYPIFTFNNSSIT